VMLINLRKCMRGILYEIKCVVKTADSFRRRRGYPGVTKVQRVFGKWTTAVERR
jgi:hypothetical protein